MIAGGDRWSSRSRMLSFGKINSVVSRGRGPSFVIVTSTAVAAATTCVDKNCDTVVSRL